MALIDLKGVAERFADKLGDEGQEMLQMVIAAAQAEVDQIRAQAQQEFQQAMTQVLDRLEKMENDLLAWADSRRLRITVEAIPKEYGPPAPPKK